LAVERPDESCHSEHDCTLSRVAAAHHRCLSTTTHHRVSSFFISCHCQRAVGLRKYTEILINPCHVHDVLQALLTPPADHNYNLRDRPHNRQLPTACHISAIAILLFECCFVTVIDCIHFIVMYFIGVCLQQWSDSCSINETFDLITI